MSFIIELNFKLFCSAKKWFGFNFELHDTIIGYVFMQWYKQNYVTLTL